jgi:hypothetical protein
MNIIYIYIYVSAIAVFKIMNAPLRTTVLTHQWAELLAVMLRFQGPHQISTTSTQTLLIVQLVKCKNGLLIVFNFQCVRLVFAV